MSIPTSDNPFGVRDHATRRDALALAAVPVLCARGVAGTSARDVARATAYDESFVHFYFDGTADLAAYCVRRYKAECARRVDDLVADARTPAELADGFVATMVGTLRADGPLQRLWYDLRSHSLYDEPVQPVVREIDQALESLVGRVLIRYADLSGTVPAMSPAAAYAALDGMFEHAVIGRFRGDPGAEERFTERVAALLRQALG